MIESGLWIILVEAAVALGLLAFIVWWTWPRSGRGKRSGDEKAKAD
jgi:hypothetical protein